MRYFRLTAMGKKLFGWEREVDGRRAHWMKLPLDFLGNPSVLRLPDSQRLALLAVGLLCVRRSNVVVMDATAVRKACHLRVAPDLARFMTEGFIELDVTASQSDSVRGEEIEERRGDKKPPPPAPPSGGETPSVPVAVRSKGNGHASWITPAEELWWARWGRESEAPLGEMQKAFSKPYQAFKARGELDDLWERWERFLAAAQTSQYARPTRFVEGLGEWAKDARPGVRAGPAKQSIGDQAMSAAAAFIKQSKGGNG